MQLDQIFTCYFLKRHTAVKSLKNSIFRNKKIYDFLDTLKNIT